jgi:hypothetical protein
MQTVKVSKLDAASRQIDIAIEMLFYKADPIAVHTLAGAASAITSNLIEHLKPDQSWDTAAQKANGLSATDYFEIMRKTQNFLKHAKDDPEAVHEFATSDTEAMIFWSVMNLGPLLLDRGQRLTLPQSLYQYWFLATQADVAQSSPSLQPALRLFGDLSQAPQEDRLDAGRRILEGWRTRKGQ